MNEERLLTIAETAARLGQSEATVRRRIEAGELPAVRVGGGSQRKRMRVLADELERQLAMDAERAAIRQGLTGVVTGRGEEFAQKVARAYPGVTVGSPQGPRLAEYLRQRGAAHDLLTRVESEMANDPGVRQALERLGAAERFEAEAQELARRIRRAEQLRDRVVEILDQDDD